MNSDRLGPELSNATDYNAVRGSTSASMPVKDPQTCDPTTTKLLRSSYVIVLASLYSIIAVLAWILICILSRKPIGLPSYIITAGLPSYGWNFASTARLYTNSEHWYTGARVLNSVANTLAIPVISTVCAKAAVPYLQKNKIHFQITMRQMMILADRGRNSPHVYMKLLTPSGWRKYGTTFLGSCLFLTLIGM
jgi:hypothetical protein